MAVQRDGAEDIRCVEAVGWGLCPWRKGYTLRICLFLSARIFLLNAVGSSGKH